ncbi:hypothetical protein [Bacillus wiedmannii]|uniref:hypothetical protein n=1 Tax=Bacillus wiedmannii TaxID=1890302 RepID=UPI003D997AF7
MGFGSDVIEVRVLPLGDTLFGFGGLVVNEIYIDFLVKKTTIAKLIFSFIDESLE